MRGSARRRTASRRLRSRGRHTLRRRTRRRLRSGWRHALRGSTRRGTTSRGLGARWRHSLRWRTRRRLCSWRGHALLGSARRRFCAGGCTLRPTWRRWAGGRGLGNCKRCSKCKRRQHQCMFHYPILQRVEVSGPPSHHDLPPTSLTLSRSSDWVVRLELKTPRCQGGFACQPTGGNTRCPGGGRVREPLRCLPGRCLHTGAC